ncbi:branched-chain amino acid ABC transporter permease [Sneathiella sp. CAU 1612]|uniref:Branched-chain amino acid ABC transporter permease n=1 Tax=Sneathiella sedimenti TaxID=2816034 RepID=A0ABS3F431_9PROT|nr:branched-chain amino acid ABC transporter permease [Sneathiella sedimenti]MBO0333122.1 branched-chain amino acid ABC transporter permease [Sneathiella sedimenti]
MKQFLYFGAFALWIVMIAATPLLADNYTIRVAISIAMFSAMAVSWNFIGGFTGYPSFSTAAFFGLGCYAGALAQRNGVPLVLAWVFATLFVAVFAAMLGAIILRLKGHYFAIGSIAIVDLTRLITSSWGSLTGGGDGLNVPLLQGNPQEVSALVLYVMLTILIIAFLTSIYVDRSRLGFGLKCISQNEDAADMVGVNTTSFKIVAYTLSAVFCGAIGAVYASWVGYIDPTDSFSILLTLKVPVMVLLGGAGTLLGPVLGAGVFVLLEEVFWANFLEWNRAILGGIIVFLIFFLPNGLLKIQYRDLFKKLMDKIGDAPKQVEKSS